MDTLLDQRKKIRRLSQSETNIDYQQQIIDIEEEISNITNWKEADDIWRKFEKVADSDSSNSTQAMWKWKKTLFPKIRPSPPLGIKDRKGNVKTSRTDIEDIYEKEYLHRLRDRPIIPELSEIMNIQKQLFWKRLESASRRSLPPWTMVELEKVLSSLKQGKSRDPSGLVCTILRNLQLVLI